MGNFQYDKNKLSHLQNCMGECNSNSDTAGQPKVKCNDVTVRLITRGNLTPCASLN